MLRNDNPQVILNARLPGNGDYATPEQGPPITRPAATYWELCLTTNDSWGYQQRDHDFKTPTQVIGLFADTIGMGGNLLLDIGARADGTIPQEQVDILDALGHWIHQYPQAIYGTDAGVPKDYYSGPSTLSADHRTLYLFVDGKPNGPILVKGLMNKVVDARLLGSNAALKTQLIGNAVNVPGLLYIDLAGQTLDPQMSVVALQLDGPLKLYKKPADATTGG